MNHIRHKRRGMIMILMLACLAVAAALLMTGIKLSLSTHRVAQTSGWSIQAQWLTESGFQRAAAQLASDADYTGETWKIPGDVFGGDDAGIVKIEVNPVPDQANRRLVRVQADYPDDPNDRARYNKELTIELP